MERSRSKGKGRRTRESKARIYVDTKAKYYALYIEEQTDELGEDEIKRFPLLNGQQDFS